MNKNIFKTNYEMAMLMGVAALVMALIEYAIKTSDGNMYIEYTCSFVHFILTITTYVKCGGFRKTIKYSFLGFMDIGSGIGEAAKENVEKEIKKKGYTYVDRYENAMLMGPVAKIFLFNIWLTCLTGFPLAIAISAKSASRNAELELI